MSDDAVGCASRRGTSPEPLVPEVMGDKIPGWDRQPRIRRVGNATPGEEGAGDKIFPQPLPLRRRSTIKLCVWLCMYV